jgi:ornithine decarboxylase
MLNLTNAALRVSPETVEPLPHGWPILRELSRATAHTDAHRIGAPEPDHFESVEALVEARAPDHPVYCVRPKEIERTASRFVRSFPGTCLYAVKCNPHPYVLKLLHSAGIRNFDVASLEEVALIDGLFGSSAGLFFNNPAKSRPAIRSASEAYGVRFYTVDHASEVLKLAQEARSCASELVVAVRLAAVSTNARYALSTKYGSSPDEAVQLLQLVHRAGLRAGLSFHVGSQCLEPGSFGDALAASQEVLRRAAVPIELLNVGGGFPAPYPGDETGDLQRYFDAIALGKSALGLSPNCLLFSEPGRALVGTSASIVAQVLVRKRDVIYINDGIYGNLQELRSPKERRPARLVRPDRSVAAETADFKVYGPTCDSDDVLGAPLNLSVDVREGTRASSLLDSAQPTLSHRGRRGRRSAWHRSNATCSATALATHSEISFGRWQFLPSPLCEAPLITSNECTYDCSDRH